MNTPMLAAIIFGGTLAVAAPVALFAPETGWSFKVSPLQPSAEVATFDEALANANRFKADQAPGAAERNAIRHAFITKAQALRAAPCSAAAKAGYLEAVANYGKARMAALKDGTDGRWNTVTDHQFGDVLQQQMRDGYVGMRESGEALTAGAARSPFGPQPQRVELPEMNAMTACQRQQAGEETPPLSLEHPADKPQPRRTTSDREAQEAMVRSARETATEALANDPCIPSEREKLTSGLRTYYERRDDRDWPANAGADRAIDGRVMSLLRRGKLRTTDLTSHVARVAPAVAATRGQPGAVCRDGR